MSSGCITERILQQIIPEINSDQIGRRRRNCEKRRSCRHHGRQDYLEPHDVDVVVVVIVKPVAVSESGQEAAQEVQEGQLEGQTGKGRVLLEVEEACAEHQLQG